MAKISKDTLMIEAKKIGAKVYKSWSQKKIMKAIEDRQEEIEEEEKKKEEESLDKTVEKAKEDVKEKGKEEDIPHPPGDGEENREENIPPKICIHYLSADGCPCGANNDDGDLTATSDIDKVDCDDCFEHIGTCEQGACAFRGTPTEMAVHTEDVHTPEEEAEEPSTNLSRRQRRRYRQHPE